MKQIIKFYWYYFKSFFTKNEKEVRDPHILFCALDGTLIKTKSGKTFPEDVNDWTIREDVMCAMNHYNPTDIHIVSNQGGIEYGYVEEYDFVTQMNVIALLIEQFTGIKPTYDYCKSNDKSNPNRKPNSGMIDNYLLANNKTLFKDNALMIGDASGLEGNFSDSDKKCAENSGIKYMDVEQFVTLFGGDE